ncbi:MAG: aminotransferase class III-fold pyridoxal phosphate-dependent enzyme, partial [Methanoregulaceae archaeon]
MKSAELFERAKKVMPGGVSSPVRAIRPYPFYTANASGSHITTVDSEELLDCCMAYGPQILGHAHPTIRSAIEDQLDRGWLYGTPAPIE